MAPVAHVEVRSSGIWQLSSVVLRSGDACLVVDPGYFPRELDELAALVRGAAVQATVFTHGHWDHVIGWQTFAPAPVWTSPGLALVIQNRVEADLDQARDFDGRWYVQRQPPLRWPDAARPLHEGEPLALGAVPLQALHLPGHSPDGLALLLPEQGLLLCGDYLSPCEIPFIDDLPAYRATLLRLLDLLAPPKGGTGASAAVGEVIPGHGPRLTAAAARDIAVADLAYLDGLLRCRERGDLGAAQLVPLPRAAEVPGMREHHDDNCRKAVPAPPTPPC